MPQLKTGRGVYEVPHVMLWSERGPAPKLPAEALIGPDSRVYAIGSCFAERVVEVLGARGVPALLHPAGLQYNTATIRQELRHLLGGESVYSDADVVPDGARWAHPYRKAFKADDRAGVLAKQAAADATARDALRAADVVVVTLGLTEIWEGPDGRVLVELPPPALFASGGFRLRHLTVQDNLEHLRAIVDLLQAHTRATVLLTVSPVPLFATFRPDDVVIANMESKSRLRAAVADLRAERPGLRYFPSYEIAAALSADRFFLEDGRHVAPDGVAFIINEFLRAYAAPSLRPDFAPFGAADKPDQTLRRRFRDLRSRVAKRLRGAASVRG